MHATTDVRLEATLPETKRITVGALAHEFREEGLGRHHLERCIQTIDANVVTEYCGEKYHHGNGEKRYQRAGTTTRTIVTVLGRSEVTLSYVKDTEATAAEQSHFRPIEDRLEFNGQKRYQQSISVTAATFATKTSYRDATSLGDQVMSMLSPTTINRRVMEYGPQLQAKLRTHTEANNVETVIPDGTKVRSQDAEDFHDINLTVSREGVGAAYETLLLDVAANTPWADIARDLENRGAIATSGAVVSDGEEALVEAFRTDDRVHQLDLLHLPRSVGHKLWEAGKLPLETRQAYASEVIGDALHLKNSVALHAPAEEWDAIRHRVETTYDRLARTRKHLEWDNCPDVAAFLDKWELSITRFATAALEHRTIPWTSNVVERLMGEVSKRCKHQWMRWTAAGVESMLTLLLVEVIHPELFDSFVAEMSGLDAATDLTIEVETGATREKV